MLVWKDFIIKLEGYFKPFVNGPLLPPYRPRYVYFIIRTKFLCSCYLMNSQIERRVSMNEWKEPSLSMLLKHVRTYVIYGHNTKNVTHTHREIKNRVFFLTCPPCSWLIICCRDRKHSILGLDYFKITQKKFASLAAVHNPQGYLIIGHCWEGCCNTYTLHTDRLVMIG